MARRKPLVPMRCSVCRVVSYRRKWSGSEENCKRCGRALERVQRTPHGWQKARK